MGKNFLGNYRENGNYHVLDEDEKTIEVFHNKGAAINFVKSRKKVLIYGKMKIVFKDTD